MIGKLIKWIVILAILGGAGYAGWRYLDAEKAKNAEPVKARYVPVKEGPLMINLIESGSIKPLKQHTIKSKVEGRVSITYIFPEGERVKEGELLVKLDTSSFEDKLANQEISAKNAEANFTQASENLEVVKNQAAADLEKATLNLRFAKEDLTKYQEGEYPKTLNEAETKVTLCKEELKRAEDKLEWSTKLFKEKYLSESDYRTDELSCKRYQLDLKSAENSLNLLKQYTYKRQMAQLESDVSQAEMALERTRRKGNADVTQAEATLNARRLELNRQNEQLEKLRTQIQNCTILAPADGLVIYATSSQGPFRRQNQEPLDVGQEVYERQDLIFLPEGDDFKAEIKIHETNLKKIYAGLPVRITVDAIKDKEFMGHITKVAPLPDAQSMFMNPDLKLYNAEAVIDDGLGVLKSGMNCRAEIIVEQHDTAKYVPMQCVVREGGKPVVYKLVGQSEVSTEIEIGLDNNQYVHIKSGVEVNDMVSLTPPLDKADKADDLPAMTGKLNIPKRPAEGAMGAGGMPGGMPRGPRGGGQWGGQRGGMGQGGPRGPRPEGGMPGGMPQGGGQWGGQRPEGGMPGGMGQGGPRGPRPEGGMPQGGGQWGGPRGPRPEGGMRPQGGPRPEGGAAPAAPAAAPAPAPAAGN